jgi:hypothetical protein
VAHSSSVESQNRTYEISYMSAASGMFDRKGKDCIAGFAPWLCNYEWARLTLWRGYRVRPGGMMNKAIHFSTSFLEQTHWRSSENSRKLPRPIGYAKPRPLSTCEKRFAIALGRRAVHAKCVQNALIAPPCISLHDTTLETGLDKSTG